MAAGHLTSGAVMEALSEKAWGKLTRAADGRVLATLGLLEHSIDVAAVLWSLITLPTIKRRLEKLAGAKLSEVDRERLAALALWHDLGKTSTGFQSKCLVDAVRCELLRRTGMAPEDCGHTWIVGGLLDAGSRQRRFVGLFPALEIESWGGWDLWLAAISHHGEPITDRALRAHKRNVTPWQVCGVYDPWRAISGLGNAGRELFPRAFSPADPLPASTQLVHAFAGLVSLADWIASNPSTGFFPYDLGVGLDRWPLALARAAQVLRAMRIDIEMQRESLRSRDTGFGDVFFDSATREPFKPTELQLAAAEDPASLLVIEAETGSGKTEAALWRFKCLFERGEVDSLAFVLPTRVSAVQIEKRVRDFVAALFPNQTERPNVLLAVPGYLRVDGEDALERLPGFEVLWPDRDRDGSAHLRWVAENTKRYLAACCAVGTIDQVLLSGLQTRHAHLRGAALLRSLLVVDEVHASDVYMGSILRQVLRNHREAGGHAMLLSATLATDASARLMYGPLGPFPSLDVGQTTPYPCTSAPGRDPTLVRAARRSKVVQVELRAWMDDPTAVVAVAAAAVREGARVLIVRNTVSSVLAVQECIERTFGIDHPALFRAGPSAVPCPHHGRYAAADRRVLDEAIESSFGRASSRPAVIVGSQTLEQSLDIDADLLITDLTPIDVFLQRVGRLHRHSGRVRPTQYQHARVIVLVPDSADLLAWLKGRRDGHGFRIESAYENVLAVDACWELLRKHPELRIPEQNRMLVEHGTREDVLEARAFAMGQEWHQRWIRLEGRQRAQSQAARFLSWRDAWDESEFPNDEVIRSRLGKEAVRLPLPRTWTSPFGALIKELAVPDWMLPKEAETSQVTPQLGASSVTFNVGTREYCYGRTGLVTT